MSLSKGDELIRELLNNPTKFSDEGRAYQLLQEFFNGFPLETLRPLLSENNIYVQSAALFIASELGEKSKDLILDIVPLLMIENRSIQYDALESIFLCSIDDKTQEVVHVVRALQAGDEVIAFWQCA